MRKLRLALLCSVLAVFPAAAQQPQDEPNVLEGIGSAVRGFFNRLFGDEAASRDSPPPAVKPSAPDAAAVSPAPFKGTPVARTVDRGLHDAIARGDYESAQKMIDRGADLEAKDPGAGASALHFAVMKGNQQLVELLVARGADVNSRTRNGTTPLHTAVLYSRLELAELLVRKGADINAQSTSGATALALAITANNQPIAARLKDLGAR